MWGAWSQVRTGERSVTIVATGSLFTFMCAQGLLGTARDALFLAEIPATHLPWLYIAVAAFALAVTGLTSGRSVGSGPRLSAWLLGCGVITLGFLPLVNSGAVWTLYALYIWSALSISVAVARFLALLGDLFTVTQAKRLYAVIGVGSALGAISGAGLAGLIALVLPAKYLLVAAAAMITVSAVGPVLICRSANATRGGAPAARKPAAAPAPTRVLMVAKDRYAWRLAMIVLLGAVISTVVDYLFKSTVAHTVPSDDLGQYFARFYFTVNCISLVVQLFLVRPLMRVLGTTGALTLLPVSLLAGALGTFAVAGVAGVLVPKGADGGLRFSLHRTAVELLYLPLDEKLRRSAKIVIDVAAQRGGKALASLGILGAAVLGAPLEHLAIGVGVLCVVWLGLTLELRKHYLNLFRSTLAEAAGRTPLELPELDLGSLESLMAALNSQDDSKVCVALRLLADENRQRIIPALILYHPSPIVLVEALNVLSTSGRTDFLPLTNRLLEHEYADVRAAALRARIATSADEPLLRSKLEAHCPVVKSTALVGLVGLGFVSPDKADPYLSDIIRDGSNVAREALARAISYRPAEHFEDYLLRLSEFPDSTVQLAVIESMQVMPTPRFFPRLLTMLTSRAIRPVVRKTLVQMGPPALAFLGEALADDSVPTDVRHHLPRTLLLFEPGRAAAILLEQLPREHDGVVRYKILRALGTLAAQNPKLRLNTKTLRRALTANLRRAYQFIDWRSTLARGAREFPVRDTEAHQLLTKLLQDKERNAVERIFRLLGLLFRDEDLAIIYRGLGDSRKHVGSSSRELLLSFLDGDLSEAVLGLIDDAPDSERLRAGVHYHQRENLSYEALLAQLIDGDGDSLRSLAVYHVGELGLQEFRGRIEAVEPEPEGFLPAVLRQTTATLAEARTSS